MKFSLTVFFSSPRVTSLWEVAAFVGNKTCGYPVGNEGLTSLLTLQMSYSDYTVYPGSEEESHDYNSVTGDVLRGYASCSMYVCYDREFYPY